MDKYKKEKEYIIDNSHYIGSYESDNLIISYTHNEKLRSISVYIVGKGYSTNVLNIYKFSGRQVVEFIYDGEWILDLIHLIDEQLAIEKPEDLYKDSNQEKEIQTVLKYKSIF